MSLRLTGQENGILASILVDAFPDPKRFGRLLKYRLNRNVATLAAPGNYLDVLFDVLEDASAQWWADDLILAARAENPADPALAALAAKYGAAVELPGGFSPELIVKKTSSFLDPHGWRARLAENETRVCRIEVKVDGGTAYGTGFLVGPRAVMTNFHVVQDVIEKRVPPSEIACRFDYKVVGGKTLEGAVHIAAAADDWLIDYSPFSAVDRKAYRPDRSPDLNELDYAVIRLSERIGEMPIGNGTPESSPRGWITLPASGKSTVAKSTLHILQHPDAEPLKLALGAEAVLGENANGTRVRYETNTLPGSSGSPGFDADWNLVALHHAGDPRYPELHRAEYNQGIPIRAVTARLARGGKIAAISS